MSAPEVEPSRAEVARMARKARKRNMKGVWLTARREALALALESNAQHAADGDVLERGTWASSKRRPWGWTPESDGAA